MCAQKCSLIRKTREQTESLTRDSPKIMKLRNRELKKIRDHSQSNHETLTNFNVYKDRF